MGGGGGGGGVWVLKNKSGSVLSCSVALRFVP